MRGKRINKGLGQFTVHYENSRYDPVFKSYLNSMLVISVDVLSNFYPEMKTIEYDRITRDMYTTHRPKLLDLIGKSKKRNKSARVKMVALRYYNRVYNRSYPTHDNSSLPKYR